MIWIGKCFINAEVSKELFWTDRKQGGRLYHFFAIGLYKMDHVRKGCRAISITVLFASFKFGWIKPDTERESD